jgi:hypothetical protein
MKLVATPDNTVDRHDRAIWLTIPFDLAWLVATPVATPACRTYTPPAEDRTHTAACS